MRLALTALGLKWLAIWLVLLALSLVGGPGPDKAAAVALFVAVVSWIADRLLPFRIQGVSRWVIDAALAALAIYLGQFLWAGPKMSAGMALLAGVVVGAAEILLHFFLASRFGVADSDEESKGDRNKVR